MICADEEGNVDVVQCEEQGKVKRHMLDVFRKKSTTLRRVALFLGTLKQ